MRTDVVPKKTEVVTGSRIGRDMTLGLAYLM